MQDFEPVFFNFRSLGHDLWVPVSYLEMRILFRSAELMVENTTRTDLQSVRDLIQQQLIDEAEYMDTVSDEWITRGVLLTAIAGLLGDKLPACIQHTE